MSQTLYRNHPHIQRPLSFQGLTGPYLTAAGLGLPVLFLLFVLLYLNGLPLLPCAAGLLGGGTGYYARLRQLSRRFGVFGLQKRQLHRRLPRSLRIRSRRLFLSLPKTNPPV